MEIIQMLANLSRRIVFVFLPESLRRHIDPDSMVGDAIAIFTLFIAIFSLGYLVVFASEWLAIDKCLDSGSKWNYEQNVCIK